MAYARFSVPRSGMDVRYLHWSCCGCPRSPNACRDDITQSTQRLVNLDCLPKSQLFSRKNSAFCVPCEHLCPKNHVEVFFGSSTIVSWEDVLIGMSSEIAVDTLKTKPSEKRMNVHSIFSSFSTLHLGIGTAHLSTSPMPQHQHMLDTML